MTRKGESHGPDAVVAAEALTRTEQVRGAVRSKARWQGWMWATAGLATPAFLIGVQVGQPQGWSLSLWIALGFMALALGLWAAESRRPVQGRAASRVDRPATAAFVAAVVVVSLVTIVVSPAGVPAWYVVLALLPAIPAAVAAVVVLRS